LPGGRRAGLGFRHIGGTPTCRAGSSTCPSRSTTTWCWDPPGYGPSIEYRGHQESAAELVAFFPGITVDQLPDAEGWAMEWVRLSTHNGTHLDAPWHYASTMDGGARALTIDEVPLDWCIGPGVKLDFTEFADGHVVTAAELEAALAAIGHTLRPGEIVLAHTAAGACYGRADYVARGCGFGGRRRCG
jgi:hypothetical protein